MEVERLPWPEEIADPEGDERRRLQEEVRRWRTCAALLAALCLYLTFVAFWGLR